jgi:predicted phosphodiesterase
MDAAPARSNTFLHLSDLHFGARGHQEVWEALVDHVATLDPLPKAALVTGDIVDSPRVMWLHEAWHGLFKLSRALGGGNNPNIADKVFVCPGNHDRYWRGNSVKPSFIPRSGGTNLFDTIIGRHVATAPNLTIGATPPEQWKLFVNQVDTSLYSGILAQGFVRKPDLDGIRELARSGYDPQVPFSLMILMMHHHALPIAELEPHFPKMNSVASVFTAATNPGRVLENMLSGHVDIVLHGHEHQSHSARYALYDSHKGDIAVIGAGSATGMDTKTGCDIKRASFNIIELRSDRSVWLKVYKGAGTWSAPSWNVVPGSTVEILNSTAIRRNRFLRMRTQRALQAGAAAGRLEETKFSEWQRHVTLTSSRDAIVADRRKNWPIAPSQFWFPVANETGWPSLPEATIVVGGQPLALNQPSFRVSSLDEEGTHSFFVDFDEQAATRAELIDTSFKWEDGILLTESDLALLDRQTATGLRKDGLEFVAATVPRDLPLASLTLTTTFPIGYLPGPGKVTVRFQNTLEVGSRLEPDLALAERLQRAGHTLALTIPYPLSGYRYAIAWEPVAGPGYQSQSRDNLIARLLSADSLKDRLLGTALDTLAQSEWHDELATVSLYAPQRAPDSDMVLLKRVAYGAIEGAPPTEAPSAEVSLQISGSTRRNGFYRTPWWGERGGWLREGGDDAEALEQGMLADEGATLVLPIWPSTREGPPSAIVRIGLRRLPSQSEADLEEKLAETYQRLLEKVEVRILHQMAE